jgi:hypothetical protein
MRAYKFNIVWLIVFLIFTFLVTSNGFAGKWPAFKLDSDLKFPSTPKQVNVYKVKETPVSLEEAVRIAEGLGFSVKPETDYYYKMVHFTPPSERERGADQQEESRNDELAGGQDDSPPDQNEIFWPPKGARGISKLYIFKDIKNNKFLQINEKNGVITYTNTNYLDFGSRSIVDMRLSEDELLKIALSFTGSIKVNRGKWDPINFDLDFSNVTIHKADKKSGNVLESHVIMKEITFRRQLDDYPVVGGGGTVRMTIGSNSADKGSEPQVGFYSRLARDMVPEEGRAVNIILVERAFDFLNSGDRLVNDTLRFYAEGEWTVDDAHLAYYAPIGYQSTESMIPVWVFRAYDSKNSENRAQFFIDAQSTDQCDADTSISAPPIL